MNQEELSLFTRLRDRLLHICMFCNDGFVTDDDWELIDEATSLINIYDFDKGEQDGQ